MVDNMEIPIKIATKLRSEGKKLKFTLNNKKLKSKIQICRQTRNSICNNYRRR